VTSPWSHDWESLKILGMTLATVDCGVSQSPNYYEGQCSNLIFPIRHDMHWTISTLSKGSVQWHNVVLCGPRLRIWRCLLVKAGVENEGNKERLFPPQLTTAAPVTVLMPSCCKCTQVVLVVWRVRMYSNNQQI